MSLVRAESRSSLVSAILGGSWRESDLPPLKISEPQLDAVTPLLYGSGAAALGWWRVRESELSTTSSGVVLQQAFRLQVLQSGIHEEQIKKVFHLLRRASIEPILVKGWAAAGFYPERGLRPYGDIDLLVKREQYENAATLLASPEAQDCWVDLHQTFSELDDRPLDSLFARSRLLPLDKGTVRVLSVEDHLALLTVHLLKHGAWRPLWLCDIGAAIEALPQGFDWNICLGSSKQRASWIKGAIGLANHLLGARTDHLPPSITAGELPHWLIEAVRKEWENPLATNQPPTKHPVPIASQLSDPAGLLRAVRERWPNPIIATISINGQFNSFPRLPYQLGNWGLRAVRFLFDAPANG